MLVLGRVPEHVGDSFATGNNGKSFHPRLEEEAAKIDLNQARTKIPEYLFEIENFS